MEIRFRLILRHWIDSLLVGVIAGVTVLVLRFATIERYGVLLDWLARRPYLISCVAGITPLLLAVIWPARVAASLRSILLFPRHCGICLRALIGISVIVIADLTLLDRGSQYQIGAVTSLLLLTPLVTGAILAYACATWLAGARLPSRQPDSASVNGEGAPTDTWLIADEPVKTLVDNRFPEHESVADRILTKLLSERSPTSWVVPSVALIGPYGSGKTSICNLVENLYLSRTVKEHLPRVLFCRFEAWQFLSPEAATRGLVQVLTESVLEVTDDLALWSVPDDYLEAIKEYAGQWMRLLIPSVRGGDDPQRVLSRIGDTLVRLDLRVVVFVDDFDRIEWDSPATQQAVAKALNEFQGVPNLQYIITVGPTSGYREESAGRHVQWDLLKLTRYQELVPSMGTGHLVDLAKKYRNHALKDRDYFFPWAYVSEIGSDPLTFHPDFEAIYSHIGLIGSLASLVNTPRASKALFRQVVNAWECGLKGEIDWYDLLLISTIKVTEPAVFEWIARDPDLFLEEPSRTSGNRDEERERKYAAALRAQLEAAVLSREGKRVEAVKEALADLFPYFKARLEPGLSAHLFATRPDPSSQKICLQAGTHSNYLQRFFAGCVPLRDVPDQPTLRYIRAIMAQGFNPSDFTRLYLDSLEKLTGPLNKVVQFAGLIRPGLAYQICDTMLDWIADPAHAMIWPEPERFLIQTLPDVFAIVDQAGRALERRIARDATADERAADERWTWIEAVVRRYMPTAPLLSLNFARGCGEKGYMHAVEHLASLVFAEFRQNFIENGLPLLPGLAISRFSLAWLLGDLHFIVANEDYSAIRSDLTKKLIAETEAPNGQQMTQRIIFSLVETSQPARSGEIQLEEYQFNVNQTGNEARYDMSVMLPVLKNWPAAQADPLTEKALAYLKEGYSLG